MTRTIFINPTSEKETNYLFALKLLELISIRLMKPEIILKDVAQKAIDFVNEQRPDLSSCLIPNFGYAAGVMFNDKKTIIKEGNDIKVPNNSCFIIRVCFENLHDGSSKQSKRDYSIYVSDTVQVTSENNTVL